MFSCCQCVGREEVEREFYGEFWHFYSPHFQPAHSLTLLNSIFIMRLYLYFEFCAYFVFFDTFIPNTFNQHKISHSRREKTNQSDTQFCASKQHIWSSIMHTALPKTADLFFKCIYRKCAFKMCIFYKCLFKIVFFTVSF